MQSRIALEDYRELYQNVEIVTHLYSIRYAKSVVEEDSWGEHSGYITCLPQ